MTFRKLNIQETITFGKYNGLKIQEIFQGSLNIDRKLLMNYLNEILNNKPQYAIGFAELELIEKFEIDNQIIKVIGQIADETKPLTEDNRVSLGNLEEKISRYINQFFRKNNLGVLKNIIDFSKEKKRITPLGGDPDYLIWCEKNISKFQLEESAKDKLENLKVCRFNGIYVLYKGKNEYEYREIIELEKFGFRK